MLNSWIDAAEGFLLVYAINDRESFECLKTKYDAIKRNKRAQGQPVTILVVGNKCDLPKEERKVSKEEAIKLCRSWDVLFMETSALVNSR